MSLEAASPAVLFPCIPSKLLMINCIFSLPGGSVVCLVWVDFASPCNSLPSLSLVLSRLEPSRLVGSPAQAGTSFDSR